MDASLQARAPTDASEQSIHLNIYSNGADNVYIKQNTPALQAANQNPIVFTPRTVITNVDGFAVTSVGIPYTFVTVTEDIDIEISFVQSRMAANDGNDLIGYVEGVERQLVFENAQHYYVDTTNDSARKWKREWRPSTVDNPSYCGATVYKFWDATTHSYEYTHYQPLGDLHGTLADPFHFKLVSGIYTTAAIITAFSTQWATYRARKSQECIVIKNASGMDPFLSVSYDHLSTFYAKAVLELVQTADQKFALATSTIDAAALNTFFQPGETSTCFVRMTANNSPFIVTTNTPGVGSTGTFTIDGRDLRRGQIYIADTTMIGQTITHDATGATLTVTAVELVQAGAVPLEASLPIRLHSETIQASEGYVKVTWTSTYSGYTVGTQATAQTFKLNVDNFGIYGGTTIEDIAEIDSLAWTIPMVVQHGSVDLLGQGLKGRNEAREVAYLLDRSTMGNPQLFTAGEIKARITGAALTSTYTGTNSQNQSTITFFLSDNQSATWDEVTDAAMKHTPVALHILSVTYLGKIVAGMGGGTTDASRIFTVEWDVSGPVSGGTFIIDAVIPVIIIFQPPNGLLTPFTSAAPRSVSIFSQDAAWLSDYRAHVHYRNLQLAQSSSPTTTSNSGKVGWVTLQDTAGMIGVTTDRLYLQFGDKHQISETRRIFIDSYALASDVRLYQSDFLLTIDSIPIGSDVNPYDLIRQENNAGDNIRTFQNPRQIDQIDLTLMGEFTRVNADGNRVVEFRQLNMNGYPWWVELVLYRKSVQIYPWVIPKPLQVGGRLAQRYIQSVANGKAQIVMQDMDPPMESTQLNARYPLSDSPYGWAS